MLYGTILTSVMGVNECELRLGLGSGSVTLVRETDPELLQIDPISITYE